MMELTVREFATKERVTERTVRTWIAKGAVDVRRTPGGGVRILERRSDGHRGAVFFDMKNPEERGRIAG